MIVNFTLMSQFYYNLPAQNTYHDENNPFEFDLSRPLKDYPYPPRQTTFDFQSDTIHLLPTYWLHSHLVIKTQQN